MADAYFKKLPNMYYNGTLCKDISRRVATTQDATSTPFVFYPYELKHELRSDHIAEYYYNDSELDWLIYITNGVVDPYYGWYLNGDNFEKFIRDKYGSPEIAMKKVKYYINNWSTDDTELSVSLYENTIDQLWKKYYTPVWGPKNKILSYKRKEDDTVINTNRILDYTISANNNEYSLEIGETIDLRDTPTNTVATGEVTMANATHIFIQSVSGNTFANSSITRYIVGETNGANVTVNGMTTVKENVTDEEEVFWTPVTYYDYEYDKNEQKKILNLVDNGLKDLFVEEFIAKIRTDVDPLTNLSNTD